MPKKRCMKRHPVTQPSDPSYRLIALTRQQNAIVDAEDFEHLSQFNWYAHWGISAASFYAARWISNSPGPQIFQMMHTEIMGGMCDHKNHDTLDNRRENLRPCTHSQNAHNQGVRCTSTSGFKGVSFYKKKRRWRARIMVRGKRMYLGDFRTKEEAGRAYDEAAKEHHGEFAVLNFPNGPQNYQ